jgi:two-component sensor histidine kinase
MSSLPEQRPSPSAWDVSVIRWGLKWWRVSWRVGLPPQSASSFAFALVCVGAATLVRLGLGLLSPDSAVFAPYYSATLVAALVGGASAGALAAAVGGIVALCLFVPQEWALAPFRLEQTVSVLLFAASSVVIIWAAESYRSLLRRLREEEASRELLNHELNHRIKNILASVQAIVYQTLYDQNEIRDRTIARITSLAGTHNALAKSNWRDASLREILVREFTPYDLSRFRFSGQDVRCPSEIAILLALVVHELTTNALKYGALSRHGGWVSLTWIESNRTLCLEWIERGGPRPSECRGSGFGTKLLQAGVRRFNGSVAMNFEPSGLRVRLLLNLPSETQAKPLDPAKKLKLAEDR